MFLVTWTTWHKENICCLIVGIPSVFKLYQDIYNYILSQAGAVTKSLAVSSSPRPWMDVFALPEKSNMAVTESDPDTKVRKMSITLVMSVRPLSWAYGHGTGMLLILKKAIFDPITPRYFPIWQSKECPTILCAVNLWWGYKITCYNR